MRRTALRWMMAASDTGQHQLVRLNKLLAQKGLCSRREADFYLQKGWVLVNGRRLEPGAGVGAKYDTKTTMVELSQQALQEQWKQDTILFHKPLGIVSSQPEHEGQTPAVQLLTLDREYHANKKKDERILSGRQHRHRRQQRRRREEIDPRSRRGWAVAGRLDVNSTGLLVLTQSGRVARDIIGPLSQMEKEYLVRIPPSRTTAIHNHDAAARIQEQLERLRDGIQDQDDFLQAKQIDQINEDQFRFVLTTGKYHHIRRMCHAVGLWPVQALKRVRIGKVVLGDLPVGQWRYLQPHERFS